MMQLVKYENACRAIAEARSVDEVREITNRAEAARAYAKQAKNRQLEIDACEIRVRAERRLGEILVTLKENKAVAIQGRRSPDGNGPIRLSEIGIDHNLSSIAQRLAMLPGERFEQEIGSWREAAETAIRLETPLQSYRIPSIKGDRQRAAAKLGRSQIDFSDSLDKFRVIDGRRVADWRVGELRRLADLARRMLRCAETLIEELPVANADPLATMEMVFEPRALTELLGGIWGGVSHSDAGLVNSAGEMSRRARTRVCERCGKEFIMRRPSGKARRGESNEGRFCSRRCAHASRRTKPAE